MGIGELLWLNSTNLEKPIDIYINSIGTQNRTREVIGLDNEVYAVTDTLTYIRPLHHTLSIGQTLGSAVILLASGETGKRYALSNSRIMTCPPRIDHLFGPLVNQLIRANQLDYISEVSLIWKCWLNSVRSLEKKLEFFCAEINTGVQKMLLNLV